MAGEMEFLSDNLEWSARRSSICIGADGKSKCFQGDQADAQLADFLGHNATAVRWQVWTALLTYVLFAILCLDRQMGP